MKKYNENNERIKRKYLTFLKQAKGQNVVPIHYFRLYSWQITYGRHDF